MNKYQDALDRLIHYLVPFHATSTKENAKMINDCLNTFKELVDKETLMKVKTLGHDEDWLTGLKIAFGKCPKCNFPVCDDEFYCRNCGQRVYFEESEE